jgi:hypothetical protein
MCRRFHRKVNNTPYYQRLYQDPHNHKPIWLKVHEPNCPHFLGIRRLYFLLFLGASLWTVWVMDGWRTRIPGRNTRSIHITASLQLLFLVHCGDKANKLEYTRIYMLLKFRDKEIGQFDGMGWMRDIVWILTIEFSDHADQCFLRLPFDSETWPSEISSSWMLIGSCPYWVTIWSSERNNIRVIHIVNVQKVWQVHPFIKCDT